jgi:hypothetical protein
MDTLYDLMFSPAVESVFFTLSVLTVPSPCL